MNRFVPLLALGLAAAAPALAESTWFTGATIYPIETPPIPNGVLHVDDGKIVELGAGLVPPTGASVVDLAGKRLYPGFVHPASPLGIVEIGSVRGTVDNTEIGVNNAHLRTEVAFNADSLLLAPAMGGGVLTANVAASGGLVSPASAVMRLSGWNWREMTMKSRAALYVDFPDVVLERRNVEEKERDEFETKSKEKLRELDDLFDRARAWRSAWKASPAAGSGGGNAPRVDFDAGLDALSAALDGSSAIFVDAHERRQIGAALDWIEKQKLARTILVSGSDALFHAERLAKAGIPVLVNEVLTLPRRATDPYDAAYSAPARLHAAGVKIAIGDGGDHANARNLPFHAGMAVAFGLPEEVALRAITLTPAELLGVGDRVGSLAPGKEATFFVADGDPLEIESAIQRVFVRGSEIDLERDRQRQLWRRYSIRPAAR